MSATISGKVGSERPGIPAHRYAESRGLDHTAALAQGAHLGGSHAEYERSALRLDVDETLCFEAQEGLTDRRLADAELGGKRRLGERLAELIVAFDDMATDMLGGLVRE